MHSGSVLPQPPCQQTPYLMGTVPTPPCTWAIQEPRGHRDTPSLWEKPQAQPLLTLRGSVLFLSTQPPPLPGSLITVSHVPSSQSFKPGACWRLSRIPPPSQSRPQASAFPLPSYLLPSFPSPSRPPIPPYPCLGTGLTHLSLRLPLSSTASTLPQRALPKTPTRQPWTRLNTPHSGTH